MVGNRARLSGLEIRLLHWVVQTVHNQTGFGPEWLATSAFVEDFFGPFVRDDAKKKKKEEEKGKRKGTLTYRGGLQVIRNSYYSAKESALLARTPQTICDATRLHTPTHKGGYSDQKGPQLLVFINHGERQEIRHHRFRHLLAFASALFLGPLSQHLA